MSDNNFTFTRSVRLTESALYKDVFSKNFRVSDQYWTILVHKRIPISHCSGRLGLAIAKKRISLSVSRNRLKRIARESFRLNKNELRGVDMVLMANSCCKQADNALLHASLKCLWKKIIQRCKS